MKRYLKEIRSLLLMTVMAVCLSAVPAEAAGPVRPAVPVMKGVAKKNVVTLTWDPVKNASGYQIYLYYGSEKCFKRISTISAAAERKLTLTGSTDRIYRYKIRAYNRKNRKNAYSSLSQELQIKTAPCRVSASAKRKNGQSAVVSWNRLPSAEGYQVVRAEKREGPYKRMAVIRGNNTFSYTDNSLVSTKPYYYRVRAYRRNPEAVVYGSYSIAKCAEVRPLMVIGDSRTVALERLTEGENVTWICKGSMGYNWLKETAIKEAEKQIKGNEDVFIWLGVNDVDNISRYIDCINGIAQAWKKDGVNIYVLAVGPVENDPYVTNAEIEIFNARMKAGLKGVRYLDLYSYLKKNGYDTIDGTHYDEATSKKVYSYICTCGV